MTKYTKDYQGKMMRVSCISCGEDITTQMMDIHRTPKSTICKSCRYENEKDRRWYREQ